MQEETFRVRSIKYNFIMNIILKMSLIIFPLITFPYVSRVLGADGNGKISFVTSVVTYASMVAMLGIPTYGIRVCAQCRDNKKELSRTVQELLIISSVMTVFTYIVLLVLIYTIPKFYEYKELLLLMSLTILLSSIGMEWFYQAIEQYQYITYRNIAFKILAVFLMFVFVKSKQDVVIYGGITIIGTVGSNVLNALRIRKYIYIAPQFNYNLRRHIKPTMNFFLLTVASTIYSNLDTVMIGLMKDDFEVGYYNAGVKIRSMLLSIVNALATVLLPRISYLVKNKMEKEFKKIITTSIQIVQFFAIPLTLYFIIEASDSIVFLAGSGYKEAVLPMIIIMPTLLIAGLNNLTGIQVLGAMGLEKYTVVSTTSGAIFDLIMNFFLIPKFGAAGASLSTMLTECLVLMIQVHAMNKYIKIEVDIADSIKILFSSICCCVVIVIIRKSLGNVGAFVKLGVTAIMFFSIYILILFTMREIVASKYILNPIKSCIFNKRRK